LSLVRSLVELHGGCVEARSRGAGLGSEFVVRLRLLDSAAAEAPEAITVGGSTLAPARRILVVDDTRDIADALAMLLETMDADVRVAYDGRSALNIVTTFAPEIVLLDIGMPGMDGYETARRLRQLLNGQAAMLVALTGWGQEADRHNTREAGFDKHLVKPIDVDDLLALLAERR
jgi:CheY-like chemotaxis protein